MRTYLVVIDETPEAGVALRFAARRAAKTGGMVEILALIAPVEFVGLGGVQATVGPCNHSCVGGDTASAAGSVNNQSKLAMAPSGSVDPADDSSNGEPNGPAVGVIDPITAVGDTFEVEIWVYVVFF